jgi:hypothetical protein
MDQSQKTPLNLPPISNSAVPGNPQSASQGATVVANQPLPVASNSQNMSAVGGTGIAAVPSGAKDMDLIEKEWIASVENIIEKTSNDPFEQSRQLSLLKANYLQKRYNKAIRTD